MFIVKLEEGQFPSKTQALKALKADKELTKERKRALRIKVESTYSIKSGAAWERRLLMTQIERGRGNYHQAVNSLRDPRWTKNLKKVLRMLRTTEELDDYLHHLEENATKEADEEAATRTNATIVDVQEWSMKKYDNGRDLLVGMSSDGRFIVLVKSICECLELSTLNIHNHLKRIPDKHKGNSFTITPGGKQLMWVLDEPGFYRFVLRSNSVHAEPLMELVTEQILPTLRKTGKFSTTPEPKQLLNNEEDTVVESATLRMGGGRITIENVSLQTVLQRMGEFLSAAKSSTTPNEPKGEDAVKPQTDNLLPANVAAEYVDNLGDGEYLPLDAMKLMGYENVSASGLASVSKLFHNIRSHTHLGSPPRAKRDGKPLGVQRNDHVNWVNKVCLPIDFPVLLAAVIVSAHNGRLITATLDQSIFEKAYCTWKKYNSGDFTSQRLLDDLRAHMLTRKGVPWAL